MHEETGRSGSLGRPVLFLMADMISAKVKINLKGLTKFGDRFKSELKGTATSGPVASMKKQWAMRYRSFAQLRFDKASKGDGTWPPLKASTIARRRKGSSTILRDTGTLFAALNPVFMSQPGALQSSIPWGIRVGFGGPSRHPSGAVSVADIASFHHFGKGVLPVRKILVSPPQSVVKAMVQDAERAAKKLADDV